MSNNNFQSIYLEFFKISLKNNNKFLKGFRILKTNYDLWRLSLKLNCPEVFFNTLSSQITYMNSLI